MFRNIVYGLRHVIVVSCIGFFSVHIADCMQNATCYEISGSSGVSSVISSTFSGGDLELPTVGESEIDREVKIVLSSISTNHNAVLDSEKFVVDPKEQIQVRTKLVQRKLLEGRDFFSCYRASRNTYLSVMQAVNPKFKESITEQDEIEFCGDYWDNVIAAKEKGIELPTLVEPWLYPAYTYCHRGLLMLIKKSLEA